MWWRTVGEKFGGKERQSAEELLDVAQSNFESF